MAPRLALLTLLLATLVPSALRPLSARPAPPRPCVPEGRGVAPRHWIGCAADPGPPRPLTGRERLLLGLPVDLATATADDLTAVPGLSARLAAEVVADRARRGPFASVEDLIRVRGVGPARLAQARPHLMVVR
jgi:competence protein ComEA